MLIPKELRDKIGMTPGSTVDISFYGEGPVLVGLAARENGLLLGTRDARAKQTYLRVGVQVELIG